MKIDWDAGHGPLTGPLNTAGATFAAAWTGHVAGMPPLWAAATAGAGLLGHHIAGVRHRVTGATLAMRAATWTGAGTWCSWAMATSPLTATAIGSLAAGTAGLSMAWLGERHATRKAEQHAADQKIADLRDAATQAQSKLAAEWQDRIARVCNIHGIRIVGIEQWPTGAGYTLDAELPAGGTTWRNIRSHADGLAADAKLPEGCGVQVGAGAHRGAVLLDVATVNHLLADIDYPDDYSPLTINEPVNFGVFPDGTPAEQYLREASIVGVGQRGSGKTNFMNVALAGGVRMTDNLDWVIDLNGGGLALAWMHAWEKAGRPGRPPIDWVADTPEKALAMSRAAVDIAKARKPGYKAREIEANDDKLPVGPDVPAITVRCDEIAELFSPKAMRDPILRETAGNLVQLMEIARAVAINEVLAALRATQDVISEPQLLKQSYIRIGLRVTDQNELAYLFGWEDKATPEDAPYPGSGLVKVGSNPARPFKVFRIKPSQIHEVVVASAGRQPELDDLSRRAAGEAYEQRWENTDHLFGRTTTPAPATVTPTSAPAARPRATHNWDTPTVPRTVTADWDNTPAPSADIKDALTASDDILNNVHRAMNETGTRDPDLDQQFRDILAGGEVTWADPNAFLPRPTKNTPPTTPGPATPDPGTGDQRRPLVIAIVHQGGPDGMSPDAILNAFKDAHPTMLPPHRSALTDWLKNDPTIHKPSRGLYAPLPDQT
jgi:hypothetical protein